MCLCSAARCACGTPRILPSSPLACHSPYRTTLPSTPPGRRPPPPPAFPTVKPSMQTCTGDFALQPEPPILQESPFLPLFLQALAGMLSNSVTVPPKS